jgi:hypothetical protein
MIRRQAKAQCCGHGKVRVLLMLHGGSVRWRSVGLDDFSHLSRINRVISQGKHRHPCESPPQSPRYAVGVPSAPVATCRYHSGLPPGLATGAYCSATSTPHLAVKGRRQCSDLTWKSPSCAPWVLQKAFLESGRIGVAVEFCDREGSPTYAVIPLLAGRNHGRVATDTWVDVVRDIRRRTPLSDNE